MEKGNAWYSVVKKEENGFFYFMYGNRYDIRVVFYGDQENFEINLN